MEASETHKEDELYEKIKEQRALIKIRNENKAKKQAKDAKIAKYKNMVKSWFSAPTVILFLATIINIGTVVGSVFLLFVIGDAICSEQYAIAASFALLMLIANAYAFWFNRQFDINYRP